MAIGAIELDCLQNKFDHLCSNQELLEDRCLLAVFGEDEELCKELEGAKVLEIELIGNFDGEYALLH